MPAAEGRSEELAEKDRRLRDYLEERQLGGVLLSQALHFSWATGGGSNRSPLDPEREIAALLYTPEEKYLLCAEEARERILAEESGEEFRFAACEPAAPEWARAARRLAAGRIEADAAIPGLARLDPGFAALRCPLTAAEVARYRELGVRLGIAMTRACYEARPGLSEHQIAAMLAGDLHAFGIAPVLLLVAADERAERAPLSPPTGKRLQGLAVLTAGGRWGGLHARLTRLIYFGAPPAELRRRHETICRLDAALIAATRPGALVASIPPTALQVCGPECLLLPSVETLGGPTGFALHDACDASPETAVVHGLQAFAWSPALAGVASGDTILTGASPPEILTLTPDLPSTPIESDGCLLARPTFVLR